MDERAVLFVFFIQLITRDSSKIDAAGRLNTNTSREHVSVWFQSPLQNGSQNEQENLKEMASLVGGTFGTVVINSALPTASLTPPRRLNDSLLFIPSFIAEQNQMNKKLTKVIMSFDMKLHWDVCDKFHPSWDANKAINISTQTIITFPKSVADKANSIHEGSVDTILLYDNDWLFGKNYFHKNSNRFSNRRHLWQMDCHVQASLEILKNEPKQRSYKLGVAYPFDQYKGWPLYSTWTNDEYFHAVLENVDAVVPVINFHEIPLNPWGTHNKYYLLQNFLNRLEREFKYFNSDLEMLPLVICDAPLHRNLEEVSKFLECWQLMGDWAKQNNRSVIMYEAFDQYGNDRLNDVGWWRYKSEIDSSSFIAKTDENFGVSFPLEDMNRFSNLTVIHFNHRVRISYNTYFDEQEIQAMLELVSTQFSTIEIDNQMCNFYMADYIDEKSSVRFKIPEIVAKLNNKNLHNSSFNSLTIVLRVRYDGSCSNGYHNFSKTWHAAEFANDIFPGTVSIIAFDKFNKETFDERHWAEFRKDLGIQPRSRTNSNFIRTGTYVDLRDCFLLQDQFYLVREWVNVVIVDVSDPVSPSVQHRYMDYTLRNLFAEWRKCQQSFNLKFPHVTIMFSVSCDKISENPSNMEVVAKCWEMVIEWGKETHVEIFFRQAFETPYATYSHYSERRTPEPFGGWWKLKHSLESKTKIKVSRESFVETFQDLRKSGSHDVQDEVLNYD